MRESAAVPAAPVVLSATNRSENNSKDICSAARYDAIKRAIDIILSLNFLLLSLPLIALMIVSLHALQGRPVFIAHKRVGRGGKAFRCIKFRSMVKNPEEVLERHLAEDPQAKIEWETNRKLKSDPRVTPIGRILRKSSVDELPQFFNILRGDMSLVGPRPIVEAEVSYYGPYIQHYCQVRPGLTGSWQVSGRSDVSYPSRVRMDVEYVESRGLSQDLMILVKTLPSVIASRGSY